LMGEYVVLRVDRDENNKMILERKKTRVHACICKV